jgi:hypothetical protein
VRRYIVRTAVGIEDNNSLRVYKQQQKQQQQKQYEEIENDKNHGDDTTP